MYTTNHSSRVARPQRPQAVLCAACVPTFTSTHTKRAGVPEGLTSTNPTVRKAHSLITQDGNAIFAKQ